ncbi:cellulase family glycosylhydrolase [Streptomyces sp. NPDC056002]|uniref:cellulase family glycosylhydrolase n=1 Tax=Streptomyces sp. NPDC056002 TaxID=3345675 RepID=UPI0035E2FFF3
MRQARSRRRRAGWVAGLFLALLATAGTAQTGAVAAARPAPAATASAMDTVAAMQPGWNLGNTLDAIPEETSWGNPPVTKALFDTVKSQGFRSVRIPVTWGNHQASQAPYTIDATFLSRVRQVADWAQADGLRVVLNVHHDSWQWINKMATDHDQVLARYNATWQQIATAFKDEPRTLLFESINEPAFDNADDARKAELVDELNTSFHSVVRASGGANAQRLLVLPTVGATPDQALMDDLATTIDGLDDPNLVATVHYYSFWPFSVNIAGYTRFDATVRQDMTDAFARMHDTFVAKGIPVYLGEYGLLSYPDYTHQDYVERGEALKYFEALGHTARVNGVTTALWDPFSLLNRETLRWRDPALFALIRASWTARSGTASSDRVYVRKAGAVTDQSLTLDLNGTSFRSLWEGGGKLAQGVDYTVSHDRLTLTAAALTRLTGDRAYGVNATLQARFSSGVPWRIDVTTYDPPVLADATGTTGAFAAPVQFWGDSLATMEAKYADGTGAGPAGWTSYQQFGTSFAPDYDGGTLDLTADFLHSLKDGVPVTLTFHFWSGTTLTYKVTRSGDEVTGTAVS